jgi:glutathione S-transferase
VRLYSGPLSLFTAKVRIALDEKGLAYEKVSVSWSLERRYEPHHPEVVALNPKRQVPVLVDGDVVVYDSTQILEYLEDRAPEPPLYPRDVAGRARCRRLEAEADEWLFPPLWDLIEETFYAPAPGTVGRDPARAARARAALAAHAERLDAELQGRSWLCDAFGVADIATFVMGNAAATLGAPPPGSCAALRGWQERMAERPAVRRELEATGRFLAEVLASTSPRLPQPALGA